MCTTFGEMTHVRSDMSLNLALYANYFGSS